MWNNKKKHTNKTTSIHDYFCKRFSAHEINFRLNGDELLMQ